MLAQQRRGLFTLGLPRNRPRPAPPPAGPRAAARAAPEERASQRKQRHSPGRRRGQVSWLNPFPEGVPGSGAPGSAAVPGDDECLSRGPLPRTGVAPASAAAPQGSGVGSRVLQERGERTQGGPGGGGGAARGAGHRRPIAPRPSWGAPSRAVRNSQ